MPTATRKILYRMKSKVLKFLSDVRLYPLGIVLYGQTGYKVKGEHVRQITDVLKTGDVLLTRYDHYLGYFVIPGYWGHAGIYVGGNEVYIGDGCDGQNSVVHMLGGGIEKHDILTFTRKDHILVLRCKDGNRAELAAERAMKLYDDNVAYDYDFAIGNTTFYCSEMIWFVYDKDPFIRYERYIMPADLICPLFAKVLEVP